MGDWKFVESEDDGAVWMRNTRAITALVEFREGNTSAWHRIMVVTRAWVEEQLDLVRPGADGGGRVVFSPMLVVPDGDPSELRVAITKAVEMGGLSHFAAEVKGAEM